MPREVMAESGIRDGYCVTSMKCSYAHVSSLSVDFGRCILRLASALIQLSGTVVGLPKAIARFRSMAYVLCAITISEHVHTDYRGTQISRSRPEQSPAHIDSKRIILFSPPALGQFVMESQVYSCPHRCTHEFPDV